MEHKIDLSNYEIRTDLAIDALNNGNLTLDSQILKIDEITVTRTLIDESNSKVINKLPGNYTTIEFDDITDSSNALKVKKIFKDELKNMLDLININDDFKCLIIGLGNSKSTPDSLGPLSISNILVTRHLFLYGEPEAGFRNVCAIAPGVTGESGIETSDVIESIVSKVNPDFVIVIDALASSSLNRINKTIQMSDTGIHPGSGVGNKRKEISSNTLNIPVIAIGIPTVVDAITVVSDTINFMQKKYAYSKDIYNSPMSNLVVGNSSNYLKKDYEIKKEDKEKLLGIVGSLNDSELKQLLFEVLTPIGYNLIVTPKEIDFLIDKLSNIIGDGINSALHKNIDLSIH